MIPRPSRGASQRPEPRPEPASSSGHDRRSYTTAWGTTVEMRREAWDPMFADRRADQIVLPILALSGDTPEEFKGRFTPEMRELILEQLPVTLQMIAAYWRDMERALPRREPVRSTKVGRNAPCPCGSGLKFKRCCGLASPSTLH